MLITEKLLSLEEAANRLNVCKLTLRTWDNEKKLPAVKTKGGHRRYRESDILKFQGHEKKSKIVKKSSKKVEKLTNCADRYSIGSMEAQMEQLIGIKKAAALLNVCTATLRAWDKEGKVKAVKTQGGHRRYRLSDIQKLQEVA